MQNDTSSEIMNDPIEDGIKCSYKRKLNTSYHLHEVGIQEKNPTKNRLKRQLSICRNTHTQAHTRTTSIRLDERNVI